ncbi:MAG: acetyl-CoA carboxylase biotin carboxyl carrier protein [Saezia sp.]
MDLRKLKTLIELVSESSITELEVTEEGSTVRIVRGGVATPMQTYVNAPVAYTSPEAPAAAAAMPAVEVAASKSTGTTITSPMVGTFYSASSPGSAPFIKPGQTVQAGDTLCIIEAMKILNEIEAEHAGVITQVLAENGEPVEYGQPLFIIE